MMRVLRASFYADPYHEPLTTVVRDSDVVDTLESIRAQKSGDGYTHMDIFSMLDGTIEEATTAALKRRDEAREQNEAVLYFWSRMGLSATTPEGIVMAPIPSPLTVEELEVVFAQVIECDEYKRQMISAISQDGILVEVREGLIVVES